MEFFEHFAAVVIPVLAGTFYLGRLIEGVKTSITHVVGDVHDLKEEKLPQRVAKLEGHVFGS